jgi:hypothetical protein
MAREEEPAAMHSGRAMRQKKREAGTTRFIGDSVDARAKQMLAVGAVTVSARFKELPRDPK